MGRDEIWIVQSQNRQKLATGMWICNCHLLCTLFCSLSGCKRWKVRRKRAFIFLDFLELESMMDDLNEGGLGDLLDMQWLKITLHHGNPYDGDGDDDNDEDDNDNNIITLPKAQQAHSIEYFESFNTFSSKQKFVSFNKLWNLGQTSAWFCLTKSKKYIKQLWQKSL